MKIFSWNINGIKSIFEKGFQDWLANEDPDIVCLQEIKIDEESLENKFKKIDGYYFYNHCANKKGYSGVAVYTKIKPLKVENKIGLKRFDDEGRLIKLFFDDFIIYNLYIPNGSKDKKNLPYKMQSLDFLIEDVKKEEKEIILLGDFNVCHKEIDIANFKSNLGKTTFTLDERNKIDKILELGFTDTFRYINKDEIQYTCWSYAANQRMMNIGYRYDYIFLSDGILDKLKESYIEKKIFGSDHCPVGIKIDSNMIKDNVVHIKDTLF